MARRGFRKLKGDLLKIVLVLVLFSALYFLVKEGYMGFDFSLPELNGNGNPAPIASTGSVEAIYFCPEMDCEQSFVSLISSAESSISCALYDIDLESVKTALLEAKGKGVKVKIISDDEQSHREKSVVPALVQAGIAKLDLKESDYMHNKFCVFDSAKVWVGSMNATENGTTKNNNNAVLIESDFLAQNFSQEVEEMWSGSFGSKSPAETVQHPASGFEVYFCPEDSCAEQINRHIDNAKTSIDCMFFSFTLDEMGGKLIEAKNKGLNLRMIFEDRQTGSQYSEYRKFADEGVPSIKDKNPYNMHNKLCIFDNEVVLTGSMNPSKHSETANDESILFIKDKEVAQAYTDYFQGYWNEWS